MTLRLEVVPPLSRATAWIEMLAAGQSAQARHAATSLAIAAPVASLPAPAQPPSQPLCGCP